MKCFGKQTNGSEAYVRSPRCVENTGSGCLIHAKVKKFLKACIGVFQVVTTGIELILPVPSSKSKRRPPCVRIWRILLACDNHFLVFKRLKPAWIRRLRVRAARAAGVLQVRRRFASSSGCGLIILGLAQLFRIPEKRPLPQSMLANVADCEGSLAFRQGDENGVSYFVTQQ